jgi:HAD superfamily hydrolase (TIGR01509 family)
VTATYGGVRVLLCDADGNLFPSEEPAFDVSTDVTNRLLGELGIAQRYTPDELRAIAVGKTFRVTVAELAAEHGVELGGEALEAWVREERRAVSAHLADVLEPDPAVLAPLEALAGHMALAAVSSSALDRLAACFTATGLDGLIPPEARFSAEDSLPTPTSKPDPAVYRLAGERLGVSGAEALAVEDSVAGVRSAVGAGFPVVGNLQFVPPAERDGRQAALLLAGAGAVVDAWAQIGALLGHSGGGR